MRVLQPNEYECAVCHGVFEKGRSDEAAAAELKENFGSTPVEDCDIVCDDCFKKVMAWGATAEGATALAEALNEGFAADERH